ncbi:MAG: hypothetical protein J6M60_03785 [Clostridia bacterium]|nr:hypothetical protein [Clostridia bacterium]
MKKITKITIAILMIALLTFNIGMVYATPPAKPDGEQSQGQMGTPPDGFGQGGNAPGGSSASSVTYTGATTISSDTNNSGSTYTSNTGSENALLVTGGNSTISNINVTKSGDSSGDEADFYGTNAAVLVKEGTLNINGGTVTTNGSHANGVFAYNSGIINISDATIKTSSNNSGAIMVTGGGTLTANNIIAETDGNSSAPIRSDRGGGTLTVNGGTYTSHGTGSPVIYSTADITVNDATLTSTSSEGVVVEGKNSVTLNNVTMEATNTKLNGNSETYKSIFIYQSMSGDAEVGTSSFTAKNSKIINNKGEIIFVTNTNTTIDLENNEIINNDSEGGFLRVAAAKWGTSGSNGGNVTLNATNQKIDGDIYVDNISTLVMMLSNGSSYSGTINGENTAKTVSITLDSNSTLTLTGDSYITSLNNSVSDNSNINLNGHILYVNGTAITSTNYKGAVTSNTNGNNVITDTNDTTAISEGVNTDNNSMLFKISAIVGIFLFTAIVLTVVIVVNNKKKN